MHYRSPTPRIEVFLAETRILTLGTSGSHGPHLVPVWYEYENGEFRFITPAKSQKALNLARDPRVGMSVEASKPTRAVIANGVADVEPLTDLSILERLAVRYLGSAQRGREYVEMAPRHERILIRVRPTRWITYGAVEE